MYWTGWGRQSQEFFDQCLFYYRTGMITLIVGHKKHRFWNLIASWERNVPMRGKKKKNKMLFTWLSTRLRDWSNLVHGRIARYPGLRIVCSGGPFSTLSNSLRRLGSRTPNVSVAEWKNKKLIKLCKRESPQMEPDVLTK